MRVELMSFQLLSGMETALSESQVVTPKWNLLTRTLTLTNTGSAPANLPADASMTPGARYRIEYSTDLKHWIFSPVILQAAGNVLEWEDKGPPWTEEGDAA